MLRYILKRILQFIPVFLGVTLILFIMQNVVPGDPIKLIAGEKKMDPQTEMNIRAAHGLIVTDENGNIVFDEDGNTIETPMVDRYFNYLGNLLQGDLGTSYQKGRAVKDMIFEAYPHTVQIALVAIVIEAFVGIGAGIISAINRDVNVDGYTMVLLQTTAALNSGNSGGALINDRGQVVGITTLKVVAQDSTVEGLGFAIPMQKVKEVADWLIAGQPAMGFTVDFSGGRLGGEQQRRPRRIAGRRCAPVPQWGASAHHPGAAPGEKYPDSGGDCYPDGAPGRGGAEHHFLRAV